MSETALRVSPEVFTRAVQAGTRTAETALLDKLSEGYAVALRSVKDECAARFERQAVPLTAAIGDEEAQPKFVPPDPMTLVPKAKLAAEIEKRTRRIREQIVAVTVNSAFSTAGIAWDVGGIFTDAILQQVGARIPDAEKSTRDAIRTVIGRAQDEGWTVPETSAAIKEHIVTLSDSTATQLARTDLISSSNASSDAAAKIVFDGEEGIVKTWKTAGDDRVREVHVEADGQTVPLNSPYIVDGEALQYPGDPRGSDANVIQCRCVSIVRRADELTAAFNPSQLRHPQGHREGGRWMSAQHVADEASQNGVTMGVSEFDDAVVLNRIESEDHGEGHASDALDNLSDYADSEGKPVFLTPQAVGEGLSTAQLVRWYRRHGFQPLLTEDGEPTSALVHEPNTASVWASLTASMFAGHSG